MDSNRYIEDGREERDHVRKRGNEMKYRKGVHTYGERVRKTERKYDWKLYTLPRIGITIAMNRLRPAEEMIAEGAGVRGGWWVVDVYQWVELRYLMKSGSESKMVGRKQWSEEQ